MDIGVGKVNKKSQNVCICLGNYGFVDIKKLKCMYEGIGNQNKSPYSNLTVNTLNTLNTFNVKIH